MFEKGEKFASYPFFFVYNPIIENNQNPVKVLITVSKKKFKRAVDRNRIKRLCREAYRLNKSILKESFKEKTQGIHLAIHYIANTEKPVDLIMENMKKSLTQLSHEIKKNIG